MTLSVRLLVLICGLVVGASAWAQSDDDLYVTDALQAFVTEEYLASTRQTVADVRDRYSDPMLNYWGKRNVRLRDVVRDKINYFRRWPEREYRLVPDTLEVREAAGAAGLYHLTFDYAFRTSGPSRKAEGFGEAKLLVRLIGEHVLVVAEGGRVIQRY